MTTTAHASSDTALGLLFGPGANAAEALARQIMSAETDLDRALRRLPEATRKAAVREAAATAAGLLDVRLDGLLLTGWRLHHDLVGAARRTLASPGSTELVDLIRHQVTTAQEPSVAVLVDGRQVGTIQLGLTVEFDISALVAGIKAGLLVAIHAGSCDVTATLAIQGAEVQTASTHLDLPAALAISPGIRLLPAEDYPATRPATDRTPAARPATDRTPAARPTTDRTPGQSAAALLGADVVVVFLDDVHGRLFGGRGAAVDADVGGHQVLFLVRVGALVLGHQPAGPRVGTVVEQQAVHVLIPGVVVLVEVLFVLVVVLVLFVFEVVEGVVRLLLGQQLVQGLTLGLLLGRGAVPDPGRPPLRGHDARLQGIVAGCADQRVGRVLDLVVLEVLGLVAGLVGHRCSSRCFQAQSGQAVASWPPSTTRT
jgi:hypothetical protein